MIYNHTGCICLTFLHFVLSNVASKMKIVINGHVPSYLCFRCLDFEMSNWGNIEKVKLLSKWSFNFCGYSQLKFCKKIKLFKKIWNLENRNSKIWSQFWDLVIVLKFDGNSEICLKFLNLDGDSEIWLQLQILVEILKFCWNHEIWLSF